ncbi:MAG: patatin-like phospholipase family protein [Bacteroidales bacterium]|jgi:NTE family protein
MTTHKLGLVLSGGGARGFAHLGVAKALLEKNIKPDIISGVSAGAIAGVFLAAGMDPDDIFRLLKEQDFMKISTFKMSKQGFIRLDGLKNQIKLHIPYKNLEDLPIPLIVGVCNLNKGRMEYISSGPLSDIVQASSSIPLLFTPVKMGDFLYVDGGVLDNLPIKPVRKICDKVIAVNISPIHDTDKLDNIMQIATRVFHVSADKSTIKSGKMADLYIEPPGVEHYDILRLKYAEELFHLAYEHTLALLAAGF